jgi:hypothetical protein
MLKIIYVTSIFSLVATAALFSPGVPVFETAVDSINVDSIAESIKVELDSISKDFKKRHEGW